MSHKDAILPSNILPKKEMEEAEEEDIQVDVEADEGLSNASFLSSGSLITSSPTTSSPSQNPVFNSKEFVASSPKQTSPTNRYSSINPASPNNQASIDNQSPIDWTSPNNRLSQSNRCSSYCTPTQNNQFSPNNQLSPNNGSSPNNRTYSPSFSNPASVEIVQPRSPDDDKASVSSINSSPARSVHSPDRPANVSRFSIADILDPEFGAKIKKSPPSSPSLLKSPSLSLFRPHLASPHSSFSVYSLHLASTLSAQSPSASSLPHRPSPISPTRPEVLKPRPHVPKAPTSTAPKPEQSTSPEKTASASGNPAALWPAWVYCTRYSDRPSSGKREYNQIFFFCMCVSAWLSVLVRLIRPISNHRWLSEMFWVKICVMSSSECTSVSEL